MSENDAVKARWAVRIKDVNRNGYTENCAECAVVTDKMLAGEDFSAASKGSLTELSKLERLFGLDFVWGLWVSQIEVTLKEAGHGARAIIFGYSQKLEEGHFFNAINHGGVILYFDGQAGGEADISRFVDGEMAMLRTN